jgi:phosphogluconate dehydratase
MPELHKLTPALSALQGHGFKVALVTDGRMSGASGSVPAAIHVSPEVHCGGPLGKLRDGDIVRLDSNSGTLDALVNAETWSQRTIEMPTANSNWGMGRELFEMFRSQAATAEHGGGIATPAT